MALKDFETEGSSKITNKGGNNQHTENFNVEDLKNATLELSKEIEGSPTVRDLKDDDRFPSIATVYRIIDSWNDFLESLSLEPNCEHKYDESDKEDIAKDLRLSNDKVSGNLTMRKYMEVGSYSHSAVKSVFGTWNNALDELDIDKSTRHGNVRECLCGKQLDSTKEKLVGDILHKFGVEHEVHKQLPDSKFVTDFYIPNGDIWIEVNGYTDDGRPNIEQFRKKRTEYDEKSLNYIEIKIPYTTDRVKVEEKIKELI